MKHLLWLMLTLGSSVVFVFSSGCDSSGSPPESSHGDVPATLSAGAASPAAADRVGAGSRKNEEPPVEYSNLQVLPDTITRRDLLRTMKLVTKSLGVKCDFCHRTDVRDYASDEIEKKVIAREMMRMVQMIDDQHFTWKDAPKATCFMCHRGERTPRLERAE